VRRTGELSAAAGFDALARPLGLCQTAPDLTHPTALCRQIDDIASRELALDRDRLTQARMAYLGAFISYQLAGADLRRQTLYDFEAGRTMIDE
jgi:hypothetical protein